MTTDLPAGRELDAAIDERIFGLKPCSDPLGRCDGAKSTPVQCWGDGEAGRETPSYSTDIAAAWQVLDEMVWRVGTANIRLDMEDYGRGASTQEERAERAVWVTIGDHTAFGPAPWAICQAALGALQALTPTTHPHTDPPAIGTAH